MRRRQFIRNIPFAGAGGVLLSTNPVLASVDEKAKTSDREYWLSLMERLASPVLSNLSKGQLKRVMPVEFISTARDRHLYTHLEAFGRLLCGIAPWLEHNANSEEEKNLQVRLRNSVIASLNHAVDTASPDFMNFNKGGQPLVDAAFLAQALIRAPEQIFNKLDNRIKENLFNALLSTRVIKPGYNNWLLFSAMIEIAFLKFGQPWDAMRVDYAVRKMEDWYKGDGHYGDGEHFHWDYYNSYVIQPMLLDIHQVMLEKNVIQEEQYKKILNRAQRYGQVQERLIAPDGTFPAIGRSICYRAGAFQLLAWLAWKKELPQGVTPSQVRSGLQAVLHKTLEAKETFDKNGWLTLGLAGHQPDLAERYISTGSLYLTSMAFLPLGLSETDEFWSSAASDWTSRKIWGGQNHPADHAEN
jgi:hypothetical protein